VFHFRIGEVLREIERYRGEFELAADGYSPASPPPTTRNGCGWTMHAFPPGKRVRKPGGAAATCLYSAAPHRTRATTTSSPTSDGWRQEHPGVAQSNRGPYRPYFRSVEYRTFVLSGASFHLVLGRGFDYAAYRERVLAPVRDRYYRIPSYLPQGRCYFCERYFGAPTCPAGQTG
jgi:hypothetical protein